MGMDASQARILQLTSRLSDLEFQGQQINNARTKLSDESANYYNQLLNMDVPTAPAKSEYMTQVYTYNLNGNDYTIDNIGTVDTDGNAQLNVSYTGYGSTVQDSGETIAVETQLETIQGDTYGYYSSKDQVYGEYTPVKRAATYSPDATYYDNDGSDCTSRIQSEANSLAASGTYIGSDGKELTSYTTPMYTKGNQHYTTKMVDDTSKPIYDDDGNITGYEQQEVVDQYLDEWDLGSEVSEEAFFALLGETVNQECDEASASAFLGYNAVEQTHYYVDGKEAQSYDDLTETTDLAAVKEAIEHSGYSVDDYYFIKDASAKCGYYAVLKTDVEDGDDSASLFDVNYTNSAKYNETTSAQLTYGDEGRIATVTIDGNTLTVETSTETDEYAYAQATEQYEYDKYLYDQDQARINSELSTIQKQDKRLELQLENLDTERSTITTELDSLQTVLDDNVERTYKTFSG